MTAGAVAAALPTVGADLRLVPAAAAAWAGAGWAVAEPSVTTALVGGALLVVAAVVVLAGRPGVGRSVVRGVVALTVAAVGVAVLSTAGQVAVRESGELSVLVRQAATVEVTGTVRGDPRRVAASPERPWQGEPRWSVKVSVDHVRGRGRAGPASAPVLVLGDSRWQDVAAGARVRMDGRLVGVEPGDDVVALLVVRGGPLTVGAPSRLQRAANALRSGLATACAPLAPDPRGLLPGLTVGDTSQLPPDLEQAMRDTGLTHLTAVSGTNVSLVCGAVLLAASLGRAGRRTRLALAAAAVAGFVVLARPDPSVLRAAVMGMVGLLGLAVARRGRGVPALCGAVVLLVVVDPWLARAYGFALSVLATGALLTLAGPWARALSRWLPRWLAYAVAVPSAAQAVCGPVTVLLAPQVPVAAVPANLLVAPVVGPATVLGVLAAAVAPLSPGAAQALAWLGGWAVGWIAVVARGGAALPHATLPWPEGALGAVLLVAATVAALVAVTTCAVLAARAQWAVRQRPAWAVGAVAIGCGVAVLAGLLLGPTGRAGWAGLPLPGSSWPPEGWRVVACDVGQGDALVVRTGSGAAVLVDTGPDPRLVDGCLTRLGVDQVDLLVLTHFHADHVAGLPGVLGGRTVGAALVSPLAEPEGAAEASRRLLEAAGVTPTAAWAGLGGTAGDTVWTTLWPEQLLPVGDADEGEGSGPNDASVVLHLATPDLTMVATGDLEPPGQRELIRTLAATPGATPVDVVKVAHHGSRFQDPDLYELVDARLALVSVGAENDYGHPAPEAIDMVAASGAVVARTDLSGDLAVGVTDGADVADGTEVAGGAAGGRDPAVEVRDRRLWVAGRTSDPMTASEPQAAVAHGAGHVEGRRAGPRPVDAPVASPVTGPVESSVEGPDPGRRTLVARFPRGSSTPAARRPRPSRRRLPRGRLEPRDARPAGARDRPRVPARRPRRRPGGRGGPRRPP